MSARHHYAQQLEALNAELRSLGQLVIAAITWSLGAFNDHDQEIAKRVIADDRDIDHAQYTLEEHVIGVIATQQPVAGDLRRLVAMIEIASEFERIGDYAKGIAKIVIRNSGIETPEAPAALTNLATQAMSMLQEVLEAFIRQDIDAARRLGLADDQVDTLEHELRTELMQRLKQEPEYANHYVDLLVLIHHLERIADRTTNIAERIVFMVNGSQVELNT